MTTPTSPKSPYLFENWRAWDADKELLGTQEFELLSDSPFTGEAVIGPYKLINTIAHASSGPNGSTLAPVIVLRADYFFEGSKPDMSQTDEAIYHGGSLIDEVAALISLWTGARIRAGRMTREFDPADPAPKGRPVAYDGFLPEPSFVRSKHRPLVPSAIQSHGIDLLNDFPSGSTVDPRDEVAFVRAARMYQNGLWMAEVDPALSWLFFVSAAETIAGRWSQEQFSPIESLTQGKPELVGRVQTLCPELVPFLADQLAEITGATRKFVDFLIWFMPEAPSERPPLYCQIQWDSRSMKVALRQVYKYRSRALHAGIPFPAPMCFPPMRFPHEAPGFAERPLATAYSSLGAVWERKDLPMLLHTFELVLRKAAIAWWRSLFN